MPQRAQRYASLRRRLRTGDLVLFSGKEFFSESIEWVTRCPWSHVAMVVVLPDFDYVCLWESTTLTNLRDLVTGKTHEGVQMVPLSERVRHYDGAMAIRQLLDVKLGPKENKALAALRKKLSGRPYEKSVLELMAAAYDGPFGEQRRRLSSLFCSELVAETYQALGLIRGGHKDRPSNEYTPADFSQAHENLPWLRGRLGPEIRLKL